MMEGYGQLIMDGGTQTGRAVRSADAVRERRAKLITAAVELTLEGSNPRLDGTRYVRTAA